MRQVLKTNAIQLEIKDGRLDVLEQKVARLELALQNERQINSKSISKYVDAFQIHSSGKSASIQRTCREVRLANPSLTSGMHWIDPDGQGVGDDPIFVYCDMATGKPNLFKTEPTKRITKCGCHAGSTLVPHDSEESMDVGHCADPGCYSRSIKYNATSRQMSALAELSAECHQSLSVSKSRSLL
jgi:hypothetical protein